MQQKKELNSHQMPDIQAEKPARLQHPPEMRGGQLRRKDAFRKRHEAKEQTPTQSTTMERVAWKNQTVQECNHEERLHDQKAGKKTSQPIVQHNTPVSSVRRVQSAVVSQTSERNILHNAGTSKFDKAKTKSMSVEEHRKSQTELRTTAAQGNKKTVVHQTEQDKGTVNQETPGGMAHGHHRVPQKADETVTGQHGSAHPSSVTVYDRLYKNMPRRLEVKHSQKDANYSTPNTKIDVHGKFIDRPHLTVAENVDNVFQRLHKNTSREHEGDSKGTHILSEAVVIPAHAASVKQQPLNLAAEHKQSNLTERLDRNTSQQQNDTKFTTDISFQENQPRHFDSITHDRTSSIAKEKVQPEEESNKNHKPDVFQRLYQKSKENESSAKENNSTCRQPKAVNQASQNNKEVLSSTFVKPDNAQLFENKRDEVPCTQKTGRGKAAGKWHQVAECRAPFRSRSLSPVRQRRNPVLSSIKNTHSPSSHELNHHDVKGGVPAASLAASSQGIATNARHHSKLNSLPDKGSENTMYHSESISTNATKPNTWKQVRNKQQSKDGMHKPVSLGNIASVDSLEGVANQSKLATQNKYAETAIKETQKGIADNQRCHSLDRISQCTNSKQKATKKHLWPKGSTRKTIVHTLDDPGVLDTNVRRLESNLPPKNQEKKKSVILERSSSAPTVTPRKENVKPNSYDVKDLNKNFKTDKLVTSTARSHSELNHIEEQLKSSRHFLHRNSIEILRKQQPDDREIDSVSKKNVTFNETPGIIDQSPSFSSKRSVTNSETQPRPHVYIINTVTDRDDNHFSATMTTPTSGNMKHCSSNLVTPVHNSSLHKTPTDDEIEKLWEKVRFCLSQESDSNNREPRVHRPGSGRQLASVKQRTFNKKDQAKRGFVARTELCNRFVNRVESIPDNDSTHLLYPSAHSAAGTEGIVTKTGINSVENDITKSNFRLVGLDKDPQPRVFVQAGSENATTDEWREVSRKPGEEKLSRPHISHASWQEYNRYICQTLELQCEVLIELSVQRSGY